MRTWILFAAVLAGLVVGLISMDVDVAGADLYGATPGQDVTYTAPLNPALVDFLEARDIEPTNLLRAPDCIPRQTLTSGHLPASACDFARDLHTALSYAR